jgi:hypothetical protein
MRASIATAICPLLALCAAQPFDGKSSKFSNTTHSTSCISPADAILIANGFGQILSNFSMSFGDTFIADDYVDQSDSVATLMHSPNLLASDVRFPSLFPPKLLTDAKHSWANSPTTPKKAFLLANKLNRVFRLSFSIHGLRAMPLLSVTCFPLQGWMYRVLLLLKLRKRRRITLVLVREAKNGRSRLFTESLIRRFG